MRRPQACMILLRALALPVASLPVALAPLAAANAQPAPSTDPGAEADRLNAEGKKLALAGELEPARAKLEQAWALKKAYDIAGNLALVETRLGAHDLALEHVEFAIRTFPASGKPEQKKGLETQATELRPNVVLLELPSLRVGGHPHRKHAHPVRPHRRECLRPAGQGQRGRRTQRRRARHLRVDGRRRRVARGVACAGGGGRGGHSLGVAYVTAAPAAGFTVVPGAAGAAGTTAGTGTPRRRGRGGRRFAAGGT